MINKVYIKEQTIEKIKKVLKKEGCIQLQNFFREKYYKVLYNKNIKLKKVYIPNLCSYSFSEFKDKKFLKQISNFLSNFYRLKLKGSKILYFKHEDYTLLNDKTNEEEGITIIIELTNNWNNEYGGYTLFTKNNKEVLRINPIKNSLTIIKTNKEMKSFVKYVNHKAKNNKRIFVELKYK